jgi:hypothetical protein
MKAQENIAKWLYILLFLIVGWALITACGLNTQAILSLF